MPHGQEKKKPSGYLPSLDGWRAVAILSVLCCHDRPWSLLGNDPMHWQLLGGDFGVRLFFAISGFLITTRILEEERLVGRFDLRRFYVRRVCRIQPAAWVYLAVVAAMMIAGIYPARWSSWFGALFLYNNFLPHSWGALSPTGHFWTLSVEEHFYLLLSLSLFFVKQRRLLYATAVYLLMVIVARSTYPVEHGWWNRELATGQTQWQIHMLWLAALVALLVQRDQVKTMVRRYLRPWVAVVVIVVTVLARNYTGELMEHSPLRLRYIAQQVDFASSYFFPLLVVSTVYHPHSFMSRFLELKWIRFIGRISYSLYLWHLIFFRSPEEFGTPATGNVWLMNHLSAWPLRYVTAFGFALLSYYFVEKPLIRLGHRLAPPASPGRTELADLPVETPLPQHG